MSAAELNALEREVELTRARFASDLARLRSPHNLAEFKEDLWAHARETKDGVLAEVKARAAANGGACRRGGVASLPPSSHRNAAGRLGAGRIAANIAVASGLRQGRRFLRPQRVDLTRQRRCGCRKTRSRIGVPRRTRLRAR